MAESPVPADIAALSFEDALAALEDIVRQLEGGRVKLDEAVDAYERGVALRSHCERKLAEARQRVEKISLGADGRPTGAAPFDAG
ncbi:MAG: exodeoxyribonuclease VII small subunit [Caenispirillum bisanense]|uniref:Exodeoxyribonuclease 7 small subunit n=1 Tax=Caenispirillum bisanense TaxID=414052 RepID=A0A286G517_9PROT|nr:exodeoxyribonuclease VII small subunit [Caenispirillum bisanense]MCA1940427.1 exodeoxyribonuclease VII small subunit [Caenispirillum bisanense]MCA1972855.1 exodeoxyribonuclease VII small subunit [Caenispirillum sp.]SOD90598.1 Exodeoxyribonuclease VII small subunit [Caenispirillum bisanense]